MIQSIYADINSIQLIGLDIETKEMQKSSKKYVSYKTLGVYRHNDEVQLFSLDYLLVPTAKGFKYVTQAISEEKMIPYKSRKDEEDEYERFFEDDYALESSSSEPKFFDSKKAIKKFMAQHHPTFEVSISMLYERIVFIKPQFYMTRGFESEVTGTATWFLANELTGLYAIDEQYKKHNNQLTSYLSREKINEIVKEVACGKEYLDDEKCTENTLLPWGKRIKEHQDVFFVFEYLYNQVYLKPLVQLNSNSARSFLASGKVKIYKEVNQKFNIKATEKEAQLHWNQYGFISPNNHTRVDISNGKIKVTNLDNDKVLYSGKFPKFKKIIMSEWAVGVNHSRRWRDEF